MNKALDRECRKIQEWEDSRIAMRVKGLAREDVWAYFKKTIEKYGCEK